MGLDIKMKKDKNLSANMKTCTHTKKPSESHIKNIELPNNNNNQKNIVVLQIKHRFKHTWMSQYLSFISSFFRFASSSLSFIILAEFSWRFL